MDAVRSNGTLQSLDISQPSYLRKPEALSTATTRGILQNALIPSVNLHAGMSVVAFSAGYASGRLDSKDVLWPAGLVANAWYHAVLQPVFHSSTPLSSVLRSLSWTQKLLLGGVTLWGTRLFVKIVGRVIKRGKDDPRYERSSGDSIFWNTAFFSVFLPEAVFQALISLSWSQALSDPSQLVATGAFVPSPNSAGILHSAAIGLFCAGLGMETLADEQLDSYKKEHEDLYRGGVWSIVRHPNYLGDALAHFSFPLLLYADGLFHPITLIGPLANYIFLRFVGGDGQNERSQEERYKTRAPPKYAQLESWRATKNSFWPGLKEVANSWTWILVGAGCAGALIERGVRGRYAS